jgi:hypothetical protein
VLGQWRWSFCSKNKQSKQFLQYNVAVRLRQQKHFHMAVGGQNPQASENILW